MEEEKAKKATLADGRLWSGLKERGKKEGKREIDQMNEGEKEVKKGRKIEGK